MLIQWLEDLLRDADVFVIKATPYTMLIRTDGPKSTYSYQGFIPDLIQALSKRLRFNYELYHVHRYGQLKNGSNDWTGMIGEVMRKDVGYKSHFVLILTLWCSLLPYGYRLKHPVPDRVKPSFVIFDIRTLWRSALSVRVSGSQNDGLTRSGTRCFIAVPIWQQWASKG